jgi:hypothetical protein
MKVIFRNSARLAVVALTLLSSFTAFAQDNPNSLATTTENYDQGWRLGFGVNAGLPTQDPYDFNLGADVRLQYDISKRYSVTFTTGFSNFFVEGDDNDLGYIPAKVGFKAFVLKDKLYLLGEAGVAFAVTNDYNKNSLILAPGIGYATKYIDFSLRYEHYTDFPTLDSDENPDTGLGQIALRLAYGFRI